MYMSYIRMKSNQFKCLVETHVFQKLVFIHSGFDKRQCLHRLRLCHSGEQVTNDNCPRLSLAYCGFATIKDLCLSSGPIIYGTLDYNREQIESVRCNMDIYPYGSNSELYSLLF